MQELIAQLADIVGTAQLITAEADLQPYLEDWRGRYRGRALAVVRPGDTPQVARVVQACAAAGVAIVPQGGNTGLCGGATPLVDGCSVVINLSRMNRVCHVDPIDDTITVEAGCKLAAVQQAAAAHGRLFPLSLASEGSCEIGGNLSTNAGGVQVLKYGNTRELVLGVEVVLPDGRVWDGLRALRKDNTGYDLKQLFIGAEGSLGIITRVVLKLFPLPRTRLTAWLAVPTPEAALQLLALLRGRCGDRVSAFELVSDATLALVLQHIPGARHPLRAAAPWYVLTELSDALADAPLQAPLEAVLETAMGQGWVSDAVLAASLAQAEALWALRENASEAQKREGISIKHDISLPPSRVPAFLAQAGEALQAAFPGVRVVAFGHLGDGNLHYNLSLPLRGQNAAFIASTPAVNRIVHDLVHRLGGSISAEHGLGQLKRDEVRRYKSALEMELMQRIKDAFDPAGRMNPGKLL